MGIRTIFACDLTGIESENNNDFTVVVIGTLGSDLKEFLIHDSVLKEELEDGESVLARLFFKDDES